MPLPATKHILVRLLYPVLRKNVLTPDQVDASRIHRILVVRQHDQLGDFLLATPVFEALRKRFPSAIIGAVVRDYFAELVLHHPFIDKILVVKKADNQWNMQSLSALLRQIREGWDLAVVLNTVSHSVTSDLLARLTGARYILGPVHPPLGDGMLSPVYNLVAPHAPDPRHQTDRNLDIVRYIGADTEHRGESLYLLEAEKDGAREKLCTLGLSGRGPIVGLHVGAGKLGNRWPIENFARLAETLRDAYGCRIVLFWGPREAEIAEQLTRSVTQPPVRVPPMQLRELAACFTQCDLLVCNDTGVMHVAAAAGVPLVGIFGPTDPAEWKPLGEQFLAMRAEDKKTASVTVEQVIESVRKLLERRG